MDAIETDSDDVGTPEGTGRAGAVARGDTPTVKGHGHVERTPLAALRRRLTPAAHHRRAQVESFSNINSFIIIQFIVTINQSIYLYYY